MQINRKDGNKNHSTCNNSIKMHKKCLKKKYRKPRKPNEILVTNLETKLDQNFLWFWENSFSKIKKHEVIFKIKKIIDNTF